MNTEIFFYFSLVPIGNFGMFRSTSLNSWIGNCTFILKMFSIKPKNAFIICKISLFTFFWLPLYIYIYIWAKSLINIWPTPPMIRNKWKALIPNFLHLKIYKTGRISVKQFKFKSPIQILNFESLVQIWTGSW